MTEYIKSLQSRGKKKSVVTKDNNWLHKNNEIWKRSKEILSIQFNSMSVYDKKYIKAKVREFNDVNKINLLDNEILKWNMHYACIACTIIDFVMEIEKKDYPQVNLEECKYKLKKIKMTNFIKTKLELASELESDTEL